MAIHVFITIQLNDFNTLYGEDSKIADDTSCWWSDCWQSAIALFLQSLYWSPAEFQAQFIALVILFHRLCKTAPEYCRCYLAKIKFACLIQTSRKGLLQQLIFLWEVHKRWTRQLAFFCDSTTNPHSQTSCTQKYVCPIPSLNSTRQLSMPP